MGARGVDGGEDIDGVEPRPRRGGALRDGLVGEGAGDIDQPVELSEVAGHGVDSGGGLRRIGQIDTAGVKQLGGRRRGAGGMIDGADLSILVTVRDPQTSIFGGDIAAPVFSHLAATALRRYQIPPPSLLDPAVHDVPEVGDVAKQLDGEDVAATTVPGQG